MALSVIPTLGNKNVDACSSRVKDYVISTYNLFTDEKSSNLDILTAQGKLDNIRRFVINTMADMLDCLLEGDTVSDAVGKTFYAQLKTSFPAVNVSEIAVSELTANQKLEAMLDGAAECDYLIGKFASVLIKIRDYKKPVLQGKPNHRPLIRQQIKESWPADKLAAKRAKMPCTKKNCPSYTGASACGCPYNHSIRPAGKNTAAQRPVVEEEPPFVPDPKVTAWSNTSSGGLQDPK